jgi:hypothetical protein
MGSFGDCNAALCLLSLPGVSTRSHYLRSFFSKGWYDDCWCCHQQNGTARMGTSVACIVYATIYYSYHKETMMIPTYRSSLLYYHRRFNSSMRHVLAIWIPPPNAATKSADAAWLQFKADLTFAGSTILEWETTKDLAQSVNFLDQTISITHEPVVALPCYSL